MILCTGEALIDLIPGPDGTIRPVPGGAVWNTAVALGRPLLIAQAVGAADDAAAWLRQLRPRALNIAGPRESEVPGISAEVRRFLLRLLAPA